MQTIGERIKARREQLQLSQDELAKKLGYKSRSSINKIEMDSRNLTQSKIKAIADALDTTPSYIMGWDTKDESVISSDLIDEKGMNMNSPQKQALSEGEKMLLELFRKVPEDKQKMVIEMVRAALRTQE